MLLLLLWTDLIEGMVSLFATAGEFAFLETFYCEVLPVVL